MNWTWFLFSFQGRLNRGGLWLSLLVVFCWMMFAAALVAGAGKLLGGPTAFSFNLSHIFAVLDPDTFRGLTRADVVPATVHVLLTPLFVWVFVAGAIKRLHDRNKSGWWAVPFFVVPGLVDQYVDRIPSTTVSAIVSGAVGLLYLWGLVELYCLAGDRSDNRFGPDPLPEVQTRGRTGRQTPQGPAWDQHKELEFAPHVASPPLGEAAIGCTSRPPK